MSDFVTKTMLLACLCGYPSALTSQTPTITPETHVDVPTLEQWLHGSDLRLVAWAADFARRGSDKQLIDEIPGVIEHMRISSREDLASEQGLAIDALLDAAIQQDAQVPVSTIAQFADSYPAQALVLISGLRGQDAESTLYGWTWNEQGTWEQRSLARVAAMMLAQSPKTRPEFVARIALNAAQQLTVHVSKTAMGYGSSGGAACGDSMGAAMRPGWPQVYAYDLVEFDRQLTPLQAGSRVVIDLGGDRIVARRFEENRRPGSCYGVESLNDVTRHRIMAYWLGVAPDAMKWQPRNEVNIVWTNRASYEAELGSLLNEQRAKMEETIRGLQDRGLLTEEQANTVFPKITVGIECDIQPCPLK